MWSITKIFKFETAHRISNYNGPCRNIHGHSYQLQVSISRSILRDNDMVMDFKDLKKIVKEHVISFLDHVLILKRNKENIQRFDHEEGPILWMDYEPTAERILEWIKEKLVQYLPQSVQVRKLTLFETSSGFVEWENDFLSTSGEESIDKKKFK